MTAIHFKLSERSVSPVTATAAARPVPVVAA